MKTKTICLLVVSLLVNSTLVFSQDRDTLFFGLKDFPRTMKEFENTFGPEGKYAYCDVVLCLKRAQMTNSERLRLVIDISTIGDTIYNKPMYPVDNLNFFNSFVQDLLKTNFREVLAILNDKNYAENVNFWTFLFSSIADIGTYKLMSELQPVIDSYIEVYGIDNYKFLKCIKLGYDRAISNIQPH